MNASRARAEPHGRKRIDWGRHEKTRGGCETIALEARNAGEIDKAFAELLRARADAVIAATDPLMLARRAQIVVLAERSALPAVSFTRPFATAGGLMTYGPNIGWMYREPAATSGRFSRARKRWKCPSCSRRSSSSR